MGFGFGAAESEDKCCGIEQELVRFWIDRQTRIVTLARGCSAKSGSSDARLNSKRGRFQPLFPFLKQVLKKNYQNI
jgi:hypothetical protein